MSLKLHSEAFSSEHPDKHRQLCTLFKLSIGDPMYIKIQHDVSNLVKLMFKNSQVINPFLAKKLNGEKYSSFDNDAYFTLWYTSLLNLLHCMNMSEVLSRELSDELPLEYVSCAMFNVVTGFINDMYSEAFCGMVQKISDLSNIEDLQAKFLGKDSLTTFDKQHIEKLCCSILRNVNVRDLFATTPHALTYVVEFCRLIFEGSNLSETVQTMFSVTINVYSDYFIYSEMVPSLDGDCL